MEKFCRVLIEWSDGETGSSSESRSSDPRMLGTILGDALERRGLGCRLLFTLSRAIERLSEIPMECLIPGEVGEADRGLMSAAAKLCEVYNRHDEYQARMDAVEKGVSEDSVVVVKMVSPEEYDKRMYDLPAKADQSSKVESQ
mgnify:CR=1 FL=1